jgi:hypothetical protein
VARVLVACEFSGVVRDAFIARGHDAVSVDLLPTETPGPHYEGDVMDIIYSQDIYEFDLMIAHPPCTYLAGSGLHWNKRITGRINKTEEALIFVKKLLNANVPYIALENPVGIISTAIRKPDQIIQPWQFGHPESKTTCLWLKGLPVLEPTNVLTPTRYQANGRPQWENMTPSGSLMQWQINGEPMSTPKSPRKSNYFLLIRRSDNITPEEMEADHMEDAIRRMQHFIRSPSILSIEIRKRVGANVPPIVIDRLERTGGIHGNSTKPKAHARSRTTDRYTGGDSASGREAGQSLRLPDDVDSGTRDTASSDHAGANEQDGQV